MSGDICDVCHTQGSGGVIHVLWEGSSFLPASAWGRVCWACLPLGSPDLPRSPTSVDTWQQWSQQERARRAIEGEPHGH